MIFLEIDELIKNNQLKEAQQKLESCNYEQKNSSMYSKLEKKLQTKLSKVRKAFVKKYIHKCYEHLKNDQLSESYSIIQDLSRIDSTNSEVIKLKTKVINQINKKLKQEVKTKITELNQQIKQLIDNNQSQEALNLIYQNQNLPQPIFQEIEIATKRQIIDHKLKNNKSKLKTTPTPQKYDFIKKLFDLENTYPKIQKQLLQVTTELKSYSKKQKENFIKELIHQTKVLLAQKKFIKAKNTAVKVLKIQPENKQATKLYKKSINLYHLDSYTQAYKILKSKHNI